MLANDIKRGMRVQLRCGWYGTMADNLKGSTRMVDVEGTFREIGSVYTRDIVKVGIVDHLFGGIDHWEAVELSDRQKKSAKLIAAAGF